MRYPLAVTTTVALLYTVVGFGTPAYATTPNVAGFTRHENTSATDWTDVKTATATCPNGQLVHSTGARIDGGNGGVVLTDIEPDAGLTSVTARGQERTGHIGAWSVTAFAVCAIPNGGYFTDPVRVMSGLLIGSTGIASCTAPKLVTGIGFHLFSAADAAFVDKARASTDLTSVTVHAQGTGMFTAVRAYAICSYMGSASVYQQQGAVEVNEVSPKTATTSVTVSPGNMEKVMLFNLGGEVTGGNGTALLDHLAVTDSLLKVNARAVRASAVGWTPINGNRVTNDEGGGDEGDYGAIVYAEYADWY